LSIYCEVYTGIYLHAFSHFVLYLYSTAGTLNVLVSKYTAQGKVLIQKTNTMTWLYYMNEKKSLIEDERKDKALRPPACLKAHTTGEFVYKSHECAIS